MKILVETMYYVYLTPEEPRTEFETFTFVWEQDNKILVCPNGQRVPGMDDLEKVFKRIQGHFYGTSYYIQDLKQGLE